MKREIERSIKTNVSRMDKTMREARRRWRGVHEVIVSDAVFKAASRKHEVGGYFRGNVRRIGGKKVMILAFPTSRYFTPHGKNEIGIDSKILLVRRDAGFHTHFHYKTPSTDDLSSASVPEVIIKRTGRSIRIYVPRGFKTNILGHAPWRGGVSQRFGKIIRPTVLPHAQVQKLLR